jgi:hypothetical protein
LDVIFTIVSRNYAAQAASLMESVAAAEPAARRVVIATDGPIPSLEGRAEVIAAETLDVPFAAMSVYYDALELNTAVKPAAFRRLLRETGGGSATYLDPDIWVFRPLDAVREGLGRAQLCLTPHLTRPLKGNANPSDHTILTSGSYNLGFMAARAEPAVMALVDWWDEKCRFDCRVDFEGGLFTDQRWMDLAPGFVDSLALLRDPGLNLAYWNLEGRDLARAGDGWTVDGRPLSFFHFSGFDPARPDLLSKHQDRTVVRAGSPLAALLAEYAERMLANGHAASRDTPYAFGRFPSGRVVTRAMRRLALAAARSGEDFRGGLDARTEAWFAGTDPDAAVERAPDPSAWTEPPWTGPPGEAFQWLKGRTPDGTPRACAALLAARADLRAQTGDDRAALLALCLGPEAAAGRFDPALLPETGLDAGSPAVRRAAQLVYAGPDDPLKQALYPGFGLGPAMRWPAGLTAALQAPYLAPAPDLGRPFITLFTAIRDARPDLQRMFDLTTLGGRFRYLRWLIGGGLAEYGVDPAALPPAVRNHPLMLLARRSVGVGRSTPRAAAPFCGLLVVLEDDDPAPDLHGDVRVWRAGSGRFETLAGEAAARPGQVDFVHFRTRPGLVAADAVALHAQGVRWNRAFGFWAPDRLAELDKDCPALSFIEEVWGLERGAGPDVPRPYRRYAPHEALP